MVPPPPVYTGYLWRHILAEQFHLSEGLLCFLKEEVNTYLMTPMWHLNLPTFFIRRICSAWSGLGGERVMLDKTQLRFEN